MINIAFFSTQVLSESVAQRWAALLDNFRKNVDCSIHLVVEQRKSVVLLQSVLKKDIKLRCINDEVDVLRKYSLVEKDGISRKYSRYNLPKLRLHLAFSPGSAFFKKDQGFGDLLCAHVAYFEQILINNNIKIVCLGFIEPSTSLNVMILESVCDKLGVTALFPQRSGVMGRTGIFDNSCRVSKEIGHHFEDKLKQGLSDEERRKVLNYFEAYYKYKSLDDVRYLDFNRNFDLRGNRRETIIKRMKGKGIRNAAHFQLKESVKYLRFIHHTHYRFLKKRKIYQEVDYNHDKIVLFLPNKKNNYRVNFFSPYYTDSASIVKNISISLPLTHSLVVKDHPHSKSGNIDYSMLNTIYELENCYYIDPIIDTFEVAKKADIIFSISSSSSIEALMLLKNVICFGEEPYLFGNYKAPIKRVTRFEELSKVIRECLDTAPDADEICTYFFSMLSLTFSRGDVPDEDWSNIDHLADLDTVWKKTGQILAQYTKHLIASFE